MQRSSLLLALALALAGCQGVVPGTPTPAASSPAKLGALVFKPVDAAGARVLAEKAASTLGGSGGGTATAAAAPMAAPAGATPAIAPVPGGAYVRDAYFGDPCGPMKLESVTQADAAGLTGSWQAVRDQLVTPALADWAADARLVATNAELDANGEAKGWHATYVSAARNEALVFNVAPDATHVVKMRWSTVSLDMAGAIEAKEAIAKLTAAIKDPNAKSKEQELGKDYFFGSSSGGGSAGVGFAVPAIAVAPTTVATAPAPDARPMPVDAPPQDYKPPVDVYELQPGGTWNATFQVIGDHPVWDLNYSTNVALPPNADGTILLNYAYGMIEARTGELIRFQRPQRVQSGPVSAPKPL